jgi:hypothetical protein
MHATPPGGGGHAVKQGGISGSNQYTEYRYILNYNLTPLITQGSVN